MGELDEMDAAIEAIAAKLNKLQASRKQQKKGKA